jgi:Tol biopolymer transport system component
MAGALSCAAVCASGARASQIVFAAQAPLSYGEIYRIAADGTRIDLSKSPAADVAPALSHDGKRVAFVSVRGGHAALYVVGVDGRALRRVSPFLFAVAPNQTPIAEIAWSPDGHTIAVVTGAMTTRLYLGTPGGGWRTISSKVNGGGADLAWSRDGRRLAYTTSFGLIDVVTSAGKPVWNVAGLPGAEWSATGELAVSANDRTIRVYDEQGKTVATFAGQTFAWSPTGNLIAAADRNRLQVRRIAPSIDKVVASEGSLRKSAFGGVVEWVGTGRIRFAAGDGYAGFDVAHDRPWKLSAAAATWGSVIAGNTVVLQRRTAPANAVQLVRSALNGGSPRVLQTTASCGDEVPFDALQLTSSGQDVVYQSGCGNPSADLFSIGADGSGLRQITKTPTDERQPALSPDGSSVAYVQQQIAEKCNGCPNSIWTIPAAGGNPLQLTAPTFDSAMPFDESPSWSPDGSSILFERAGVDGPKSTLFTIAPGGGTVRSLGVIGRAPAWGPKLIAFFDAASPKTTIKTLDPLTGAVVTVATAAQNHDFRALTWSADGRLAYLGYDADGHASIVVADGTVKPLPLSPILPANSQVEGVAWSPDEKRFAFSATDANGVGEIYTIGVGGTGLMRVTKNAGAVGAITWR